MLVVVGGHCFRVSEKFFGESPLRIPFLLQSFELGEPVRSFVTVLNRVVPIRVGVGDVGSFLCIRAHLFSRPIIVF